MATREALRGVLGLRRKPRWGHCGDSRLRQRTVVEERIRELRLGLAAPRPHGRMVGEPAAPGPSVEPIEPVAVRMTPEELVEAMAAKAEELAKPLTRWERVKKTVERAVFLLPKEEL